MSLLARCTPCKKSYRVPHDRKEWHCKHCQAVLEIDPPLEEASDTLSDGSPCPECGALFFGAEGFCEECGADLRGGAGTKRQVSVRERKEASAEMRRAFNRLRRLKTLLTFNLFFSILGGLAVAGFVFVADVETVVKFVIVAIQGLSIGLAWVAVKYVDKRPFPIVTTLAALQTLTALWNFYDGSPWVISAVWGAILWMLAVDAAQVARLAKQYPDLYLSRRMRGEHLSGKAPSRESSIAARRRADARKRGRAENSRTLVIAVGVIAVVVAGFLGYRALNSETSAAPQAASAGTAPKLTAPDGVIERFRAAWNSGDIDGMVAVTKPSLQEKMGRSLRSLGSRYEWGETFPPLDEATWEEPTSSSLRVYYPSVAGEFPVRFQFDEGQWVLRTITTSGLRDWRPQ